MRKSLLICFLFYFSDPAFAQSYEKYYSLCNLGDSLEYVGLYNEALTNYNEAFASVDYVHSEKYRNAYIIAIKVNLFSEAFEYGKMALINSGKKEIIKTNSSEFKKSKYYKQLQDSSLNYLALGDSRINKDYVALIDSLLFIDQYIIRNNGKYKGNYKIDKSTLPENRFDLDNSTFLLLYQWIHEFGFPSEQNVGLAAHNDVWAILHHNLRLKENEQYHQEFFDFVKSGDYLPEEIMIWYEQYQLQQYKTTFFTTWDGDISEKNLERINANRKKFFMKSLGSFTLTKSGRRMIAKW